VLKRTRTGNLPILWQGEEEEGSGGGQVRSGEIEANEGRDRQYALNK